MKKQGIKSIKLILVIVFLLVSQLVGLLTLLEEKTTFYDEKFNLLFEINKLVDLPIIIKKKVLWC